MNYFMNRQQARYWLKTENVDARLPSINRSLIICLSNGATFKFQKIQNKPARYKIESINITVGATL